MGHRILEGRHQKENGGLLCFLEAKGLFFNPLMAGLVLLSPRMGCGLGADPRQTLGSAAEARRQSPDKTCSRQVWGRSSLPDPVPHEGLGKPASYPPNWAGFYSRWAVSAFWWEEGGRRTRTQVVVLIDAKEPFSGDRKRKRKTATSLNSPKSQRK